MQVFRALRHEPRPRRKEKRSIPDVARGHQDHGIGACSGKLRGPLYARLQFLTARETDHVISTAQHDDDVKTLIAFKLARNVGESGAVFGPVDDLHLRVLAGNQPGKAGLRRAGAGAHRRAVADDQQSRAGRYGRSLPRLALPGQLQRLLEAPGRATRSRQNHQRCNDGQAA